MRSRFAGGVLAILPVVWLVAAAAAAEPRWERDAEGRCVRVWTPSELARGPVGLANGLILPVRALAGSPRGGVAGIALAPVSLLVAGVEGLGLVCAGFTDLVTGGVFAVVPDGSSRLRVDPVLFFPEGKRSFDEYDDGPSCGSEPDAEGGDDA